MGQIQSLGELFSLIRRHLLLILTVFVTGSVLAGVYAKTRPDVYESTAVIQVEASEIVRPGQTGGTGRPGDDVGVLLDTIERRLTTRDALLDLAQRQGVLVDVPLSDDQKVALLRQSIRFQPIFGLGSSAGQSTGLSALAITTGLSDPEQAARVSNDLAQTILDAWSEGQLSRTRTALDFYRAEEARLWSEITRLDDEVAAFKNLNPGSLPNQAAALNQELLRLDDQTRALDQRRLVAQASLDKLTQSGATRTTEQRQREELETELRQIGQEQAALSARVAQIQSDLARMPEVEKALDAYDRRRLQLEGQHTAVTARLAEAETAVRLADSQQSDRVAMLERALTPLYPVGSGGKKTVVAGAMASLLLGLGLAFLLDQLRPVVRTAAQMERQTGLRPVMVLPVVPTGRSASRKARRAEALRQKLGETIAETPRATLALGAGALLLFLVSAFFV